jgi:hypothetical protein
MGLQNAILLNGFKISVILLSVARHCVILLTCIMLSVILLSIARHCVILQTDIMLSVILLSVPRHCVILPNAMAPFSLFLFNVDTNHRKYFFCLKQF